MDSPPLATYDAQPPTRRKISSAPDLTRLPPFSEEAEKGTLGCILLSPSKCISECQDKNVKAECFYDLKHVTIFLCLEEMHAANIAIDFLTLSQKLKDKNQLEAVGGISYLASLTDVVPSAAHLMYYVDILLEKHVLRQTIQRCTEIIQQAYDESQNAYQVLESAQASLAEIGKDRQQKKMRTMRDLVELGIDKIQAMHQNQGKTMGISTGFRDLDKKTMGLQGGDMIVIAARVSCGKTTLAMNIAENVAVDQGLPVGVFSLEMTDESLVLRMLCSRARVNLRQLQDGFMAERDFPKLTGSAGELAKAPIYIDDQGGLTILQLKARARKMHQLYGIKLLVIDYLGRVRSDKPGRSREQEVADISGGIKELAKELGIPVIILVQLNRDAEKRGPGERPRLSDLRESGAIESDADLVGMLYKPDDDGEEPDFDQEVIPVTLYIGKFRNGAVGDVNLTFFKTLTRFEDAAPIHSDDVPAPRQQDILPPHND